MMKRAGHIEGYAIVSADGMLTDAAGNIPASLKLDADQHFFEHGLDADDVVIQGRNSQEQSPHSAMRRRLILTRSIPSIAPDSSNGNAVLWNPTGASFDEALATVPAPNPRVAVIGGPRVFELFLDLFDVFHLSRVANIWLPGGLAIFGGVPSRTPEAVLAMHGLVNPQQELLDSGNGLTITGWRRSKI